MSANISVGASPLQNWDAPVRQPMQVTDLTDVWKMESCYKNSSIF